MKCPGCQSENPDGLRYCGQCGKALEQICPHCNFANPSHFKFCGECGRRLKSAPPAGEEPLAGGERRHVTALFSDLSGYTSLSENLDPEEVKAVMNRIFGEIARIVERYEGVVEKFIGDAVVVFFGTPRAHEDDPVRAVRAALEIHKAVNSLSPEFEDRIGRPLSMHTGINTGLVVTGSDRATGATGPAGDAVNIASRLSGLAKPEEILVGEEVHRQAADYFIFEKVEPAKVKGKAEPVPSYRLKPDVTAVEHAGGPAGREIAVPLIGRGVELAALKLCLDRLLEGHGSILSLVGEAGLGKTRLVEEIRAQYTGDDSPVPVTWLEGHTLSYGRNISYWPFREILKQYAGISEEDTDIVTWEKLEESVARLFPTETGETLPYLASFLALDIKGEYAERIKYLDGEGMGRQVFLSSRRLFERLARKQPLVLVLEDLHWADESSTLLLDHLLPLVDRVPILICVTSRPEPGTHVFRLREIAAARFGRRYTEILLQPLSAGESEALIRNFLGAENLSYRVREEIIKKADGNPFFVEEIMRSLIERGVLERDPAAGHWRTAPGVETVSVPDTIHGVIMARVDLLSEELKQVLRSASVIGRVFLYRILRGIEKKMPDLDGRLTQLEGMELIREKQKIPELEYMFKHALVQEATYESVLLGKRRRLHARVAGVIEALFSERLEEFYTMLAHHYTKGEVWDKAQEYLFKAGDQAARIAADAEALAHYRDAIETYARVFGDRWEPVERAGLERKMGEALYRRGDYPQAIEYIQRALSYLSKPLPREAKSVRSAIVREILTQLFHRLFPHFLVKPMERTVSRATEEEARSYEIMCWIDAFIGPENMFLDSLKLLNFSEKKGFYPGVVIAYAGIAAVTAIFGLHRISYRYGRMAIRIAGETQHPGAIAYANQALVLTEFFQGKLLSAIEYGRVAAEASRQGGYWNLQGWGIDGYFISRSLACLGRFREAIEYAVELARFGRDANDSEVCYWGLICLGSTRVRMGEFDKAAVNLKDAVQLAEKVPNHWYRVTGGSFLGECYLRQGDIRQALEVLEQNRDYASQHGIRGPVGYQNALAEAYLLMSERTSGSERQAWLAKARSACRIALRTGRRYVPRLLPDALRVQGIYSYISGDRSKAGILWQKGIDMANKGGMKFELGLTHLEAGRRLQDRAHLERAVAVFAEIGAEFNLNEARNLLKAAHQ